jgi:uncharacterized Zn-binding protein involved in type VI secretion
MPPAARIGDSTGHPGVITGAGVTTVLIGGSPAAVAASPTTIHVCSAPVTPPHPPTPFPMGSATVLIGGSPALRIGDKSGCGAPIVTGAANVLIGG